MARFTGKFFDGRTAGKKSVSVRPSPSGLILTFPDKREVSWVYSSLRLADSGANKGPVRVEHEAKEGNTSIVETLVIADDSFLARVEDIAPNALGSLWEQPRHRKLKRVLLGLAVLVIPLFLYLVWKIAIPIATDTFVPNIPVSWEEKLGESAFQSMFGETPAPPSPEVRKALDEISRRLLEPVTSQPYNFRIYIHPSKMFNAMALPGGIIVVFQGLLDHTETPEELAGVLAHEFQHVLLRHPTRNLVRQVALSIILAMIVGDSGGVMGLILEMAGQLGALHYTRKMEVEADKYGMEMMLAGRVDPKGMIGIFKKFKEQEGKLTIQFGDEKSPDAKDGKKGDDDSPEWLEYFSTHPMGKNRVEMLTRLAEANSGISPWPLLPEMDWEIMRHATDGKNQKLKMGPF